ncbi:tyrosine-protein phosphatase [Agaribacterium sp. ZY112]|uniref:phosphatase domain-containing protein n=1 Tax=Agaribacterium sp. ZY112 TaxID=3233574 RepID=UPI0035232209
MTTHPFDVLSLANKAKFIFTACPGTKGCSLTEAFDTLVEAGADAVITLLADKELQALSLTSFSNEASKYSFNWYQLPIDDDAEPDERFALAWQKNKSELLRLVQDNKTIVIHCRGGTGRTGLVAAMLLLESGQTWPEVKSQIQSIRAKALTLPAHLRYLNKHYSI